MIVWLIVWNWVNLKLLKVKWEGIKGLSQTFIFLHLGSPWIQILFKYKTLVRRWHDFFHLNKWKGFLKIFEFPFGNISNSETLCNSMIFTREDKMTSSKHMKYGLEVKRIKFKVPFENYFQFQVICILFKLFFSKSTIYGN